MPFYDGEPTRQERRAAVNARIKAGVVHISPDIEPNRVNKDIGSKFYYLYFGNEKIEFHDCGVGMSEGLVTGHEKVPKMIDIMLDYIGESTRSPSYTGDKTQNPQSYSIRKVNTERAGAEYENKFMIRMSNATFHRLVFDFEFNKPVHERSAENQERAAKYIEGGIDASAADIVGHNYPDRGLGS